MSNKFTDFLSSVATGFFDVKGNMGDFQHAARLYVNDTFRLAPKTKFLYYAVFNINPKAIAKTGFQEKHRRELNYLVKKMDLPKFTLNTENVNQYNRKTTSYTKISYDPVNLVFHDDNNGVTNSLWALYYGHYFQDRLNIRDANGDIRPAAYQNNTFQSKQAFPFRYGLDGNSMNGDNPFFYSIQLITLSKQRFFSYMLCNPKITNWQHDTMDQSDGNGVVQNTMTLAYDAVIYNSGTVSLGNPRDFAELHYDRTPSPIAGEEILINTAEGLVSAGFNALENIFGDLFQTDSFTGVGDDVATARQTASYGFNNAASYGGAVETSILTSLGGAAVSGISGFANYAFGNTDSTTGTPTISADNLYQPQLVADVESGFNTGSAARASAINDSFGGVSSPPLLASNYASDAYALSLPSNLSGANESNSFGSYNTASSTVPTGGAIDYQAFASLDRSTVSQELVSNSPFGNTEPPDAFA